MEDRVRKIIESWSGVENNIQTLLRREEKLSVAMSNTEIFSGHQFDALAAVAFLDIHNVTKIASTIGCSKSAVSIMLSKMLKKNLIEKKYGYDTSDKRSIYIGITPEGKEVLEKFMETRLEIVSGIYDTFSKPLLDEAKAGFDCFRAIFMPQKSFLGDVVEKIIEKKSYSQKKKEFITAFTDFVAGRIASDKEIVEDPQKLSSTLTLQQIGMLKAISAEGQDTVSKLVKTFGTSVSTVSVNVSRLARAGYVVKEYGKTKDNRETVISLTEKAKDELAHIKTKMYAALSESYDRLNDEEKNLLEQGIMHFDNSVKLIRAEVNSK